MASDVGTTILAATQGMTAFWQFMPRISDVRKADIGDDDMRGDVRFAEVAGIGVTMGVGALLSSMTQSKMPLLTSALVCAGFVFLYETALRKDRPMDYVGLFGRIKKGVTDGG